MTDSVFPSTPTPSSHAQDANFPGDVLRIQAAQGLTSMGLHQARAGLAEARAGLAAYLGDPGGRGFSPESSSSVSFLRSKPPVSKFRYSLPPMRPAVAIQVLLMLGVAVGCSKNYALARPDGGPDTRIGTTPGADAPVDETQQSDMNAADTPTVPDTGRDATAEASPPPDATGTEVRLDAPLEIHADAMADTSVEEVGTSDVHPDAGPEAGSEGGTDDAAIPIVLSIPTIRDPSATDHPASGALVQTSGIVTAVKTASTTHTFFMQAANVDKYAGVYVYVGSANVGSLGPGAIVQVVGILSNYRGIDQIDTTTGSFQITGVTAVPTPMEVAPADIATGGTRTVELQSMLVHLNTTVLATTATVGTDFKVNPGDLIVTSFVANGTGVSPFPATVGQSFSSLTGVVYVFGTGAIPDYKLAPRALPDLVSP